MKKSIALGILVGALLLAGCTGQNGMPVPAQAETCMESGAAESASVTVPQAEETAHTESTDGAEASGEADSTVLTETTGPAEAGEAAETASQAEGTGKAAAESSETAAETEESVTAETEICWGEGETVPEGMPSLPDKFTYIPEETLYVSGDGKLRSQPSQVFKAEKKLKFGETVQRIAVSPNSWSAVQQGEQVFYMPSQGLSSEIPQPAEPEPQVTEKPREDLVYTNHWVNLRKGPDASTEGLGRIPERTELQRLAVCSNGWSKVRYGEQVGYVAGMYLSDTMPEAPAQAPEESAPEPEG